MGTTFRAAAVSALALGSLTVAAGSQVHATAATSHSATDDDSALTRTQKAKAVAVAAEEKASHPATNPAAESALKAKTVAAAKGQDSRPAMDSAAARILKMKAVAVAHASKG